MIITRTPFRISFVGGGTDLREFYAEEPGAVISTTIDKYMYVTVNRRFDHTIRVSYSKTEIVETLGELNHELVREAMRLTGVTEGIEVTTIADIPAKGTGLGSSSSLVVGLLNALYAFRGRQRSPAQLGEEACRIEIEIVGEPIGKQDQYSAAYGGFRRIEFHPDERVTADLLVLPAERRESLQQRLLLFYTGTTRNASRILKVQRAQTGERRPILRRMRDLTHDLQAVIEGNRPLDDFGEILHENWTLKKSLADGISNSGIDEYYNQAREAGAVGGKILGAGGGGFLLFYVPPEHREAVCRVLAGLRRIDFQFEPHGSRVIFYEE
jgi:D-glycero-alpha-D-manno-heptose-7-phosphate kinase